MPLIPSNSEAATSSTSESAAPHNKFKLIQRLDILHNIDDECSSRNTATLSIDDISQTMADLLHTQRRGNNRNSPTHLVQRGVGGCVNSETSPPPMSPGQNHVQLAMNLLQHKKWIEKRMRQQPSSQATSSSASSAIPSAVTSRNFLVPTKINTKIFAANSATISAAAVTSSPASTASTAFSSKTSSSSSLQKLTPASSTASHGPKSALALLTPDWDFSRFGYFGSRRHTNSNNNGNHQQQRSIHDMQKSPVNGIQNGLEQLLASLDTSLKHQQQQQYQKKKLHPTSPIINSKNNETIYSQEGEETVYEIIGRDRSFSNSSSYSTYTLNSPSSAVENNNMPREFLYRMLAPRGTSPSSNTRTFYQLLYPHLGRNCKSLASLPGSMSGWLQTFSRNSINASPSLKRDYYILANCTLYKFSSDEPLSEFVDSTEISDSTCAFVSESGMYVLEIHFGPVAVDMEKDQENALPLELRGKARKVLEIQCRNLDDMIAWLGAFRDTLGLVKQGRTPLPIFDKRRSSLSLSSAAATAVNNSILSPLSPLSVSAFKLPGAYSDMNSISSSSPANNLNSANESSPSSQTFASASPRFSPSSATTYSAGLSIPSPLSANSTSSPASSATFNSGSPSTLASSTSFSMDKNVHQSSFTDLDSIKKLHHHQHHHQQQHGIVCEHKQVSSHRRKKSTSATTSFTASNTTTTTVKLDVLDLISAVNQVQESSSTSSKKKRIPLSIFGKG